MEYVKFEEVKTISNSPICTVLEYGIKDKDINTAVIKISGRYPDNGWAINEKCKLMAFILDGGGLLFTENETIELSENDMVLILPGEKYYWDGHMTILMPTTPAWYPEQYKSVEK